MSKKRLRPHWSARQNALREPDFAIESPIAACAKRFGSTYGYEVDTLLTLSEGVSSMPCVWWCNQTRCCDDERSARLVCSHIAATEGAMKFRRMVSEARAGDITVHYRSGRWKSIVAISRAMTDPVEGTVDLKQYGVIGSVCWQEPGPGWRFEADYYDFDVPIAKSAVIEELNQLEIEEGPIAPLGQIRQAYFMRFSVEGLRILRRASAEEWPRWAEAALRKGV